MSTGNQPTSAQLVGFPVGNGLAPSNGPKVIPCTLPFSTSASNTITVDLGPTLNLETKEFIQTIYADNSDNPKDLIITADVTRQRLIWPAGSQGYLPVLSVHPARFTCLSNGAVDITAHFACMAMPAQMWTSTLGGLGTDASGSAPSISGNILATLAVNGKRALVEAQNQSATIMEVVLDDGLGTAGKVSIIMLGAATVDGSNGSFWSDTTFKGRVRIACASAGKQCMLRET